MPDVSRSANALGTMSLPDMIYLEDQMQWHISIIFNTNSSLWRTTILQPS